MGATFGVSRTTLETLAEAGVESGKDPSCSHQQVINARLVVKVQDKAVQFVKLKHKQKQRHVVIT